MKNEEIIKNSNISIKDILKIINDDNNLEYEVSNYDLLGKQL